MSAITLRKLAQDTVVQTDSILTIWQESFQRGDCKHDQVEEIIDALLDLRTAACLKATPPGKKDKAAT